ncbi:alpha/beta hydrolase [Streptomyces sp. RerS4]|uniref:alpha/beta hydrolase n=1 Tax=Streptomyces sp. RerS4 TaxID=2942449 RepID=UPI00201BE0F2|nr:alpha/beta hydrolase [Streptomyces sp. RerS4]UQX01589.1 alpha/beta hydrolase [Streptomyces sp. RerS4]
MTVPLDHADPARGTTHVALARIPATGPAHRRLGPLLLNFGGPGASGIALLAANATTFATLGERYDLIGFDPRGVGHSDGISCGAGGPESGGADSDDGPVTDDAAGELAALRAHAARCARYSGPVLPYVGTVHVARDMDVIRRVLNRRDDRKLAYLGFSYGTRLGAAYAALFPKSTGRMVLDGVDTLSEPLAEQALVSARGQQRALDNFLVWCAHRPGCVYGTNTRTAKEEVDALVERLDRAPLIGQDGSYFTGRDATAAIAQALYSETEWPRLADALAAAEHRGDPLGLLQLGSPDEPPPDDDEDEDGGGPDAVPPDNAAAALAAVNCADDPDRSNDKASPEAVERELRALRPEFLAASRIFGPYQLLTVLACYGRPAGTDFIRRIDHPGAPRVLLVGTRGDPATPYEWTEETARRLGSAVIIDHKGEGHTGYTASRCVSGYVDGFLLDGRLPHGTRSCPSGG